MSGKQIKKYRKLVDKNKSRIIREYLLLARDMNFFKRLKFAWYVIIRKGA